MTNTSSALDPISTETLVDIVALACRAPSLHNSQPWRWTFEDATLHLFADRARFLNHDMSTDRGVILSCGVVLDHLRVAAAAAGWATTVERLPDPQNHDRVASIRFHRSESMTDHDCVLGAAILARRTDRLAFAAPEPWPVLENRVRSVVEGTVARLDVVDDSGRPALADASRRSEESRADDDTYQVELDWWALCSGPDDGIPFSALTSDKEADHVDVARAFPPHGTNNRRPQIDRDHSKILVLSTYDDSPQNVLQCGEVLSRVLLECTAAGFATCTLTHMIEQHASREMIRTITGRRAEPQALVRVGLAPMTVPQPEPTPRRRTRDVLHISRP